MQGSRPSYFSHISYSLKETYPAFPLYTFPIESGKYLFLRHWCPIGMGDAVGYLLPLFFARAS